MEVDAKAESSEEDDDDEEESDDDEPGSESEIFLELWLVTFFFIWFCIVISESSTIVITGPKTPKQLKKFFKTNALTPAETKQEGSRCVSCFRTFL